jgi:CBS domain-containing protein
MHGRDESSDWSASGSRLVSTNWPGGKSRETENDHKKGALEMPETVRDIMARNPVILPGDTSIQQTAQRMRDEDIGNVIVGDDNNLQGIVTDRDIVVRALADGRPDARIREIATGNVTTIEADRPVDEAAQIMRDQNVRRIPVVENGQPVGIVSIGDLAIQLDDDSALADISAARENN